MPKVSGPLRTVTDRPDSVVSVGVRAAKTRTWGGGIVTAQTEDIPVENGHVEFELLPGPAVMALQHVGFGRPTTLEAIPLLVGDADIDLEAAAAAGAALDGKNAEELGALQEQIGQWVSKTAEHMRAAEKSAQDAGSSSDQAGESKREIDAAKKTVLDTSESMRRLTADATDAADSATKSATEANESKEAAAATAREVTGAVVQAQDQIKSLTTLAKQTTDNLADLTALESKVEEAARRAEEAADRATAGGVRPEELAEVKNLAEDVKQEMLDSFAAYAEMLEAFATRSAVDAKADSSVVEALAKRLDDLELLVSMRPAFFDFDGSPPDEIPAAQVGDKVMDNTKMEIHKVTGV